MVWGINIGHFGVLVMLCQQCGEECNKRRFCSWGCASRWNRAHNPRFNRQCGCCGVKFRSHRLDEVGILCRSCSQSKRFQGSGNPAWKGGHRFWQAGKLGRDKEGLSWVVQRKLAWERDKYSCQKCGKQKEGWKPHVHHISPYRISFSHGLVNLVSLCNSCHKKEEATIKELWGGKSFGGGGRKVGVDKLCRVCGIKQRKIVKSGLCKWCYAAGVLLPTFREAYLRLKSHRLVALECGVTRMTVFNYLSGNSKLLKEHGRLV